VSGDKLPVYQCHKVVKAAKILSVRLQGEPESVLELDLAPGRASVVVDAAFMLKHSPKVGGYFVIYEDGYQSWSPAEAFEAGYSRI
jgi:hypothetical protein